MSQEDHEVAGSQGKKMHSKIQVSMPEKHHNETQLGRHQGEHRLFVDIARLCQRNRNW